MKKDDFIKQKNGILEQISDHIVNLFLPSVLMIWYIFLYAQMIIVLIEGNYEVYMGYAQITLTLFGFTLLVTFLRHIETDKKAIKKLISINLGFLLSTIGFLIVYATSTLIPNLKEPSLFTTYFVTGIYYAFSFIGLFGLTISTINLYSFLRNWYKSLIREESEITEGRRNYFMRVKAIWENYKRIYKLEIILLIPIIITGILSFIFRESGITTLFYIYITFFYFASWFFSVIITELIINYLKNEKRINKFKQKFPKKPKVFEYLFFLGLFWATAFITVAYSIEVKNVSDFFTFINNFGASIFVYGFSSACGWYHYIERIDTDWNE